ncbi:hypothetical protein H0H92_011335, partial [Tricholoma furcatifolium]
ASFGLPPLRHLIMRPLRQLLKVRGMLHVLPIDLAECRLTPTDVVHVLMKEVRLIFHELSHLLDLSWEVLYNITLLYRKLLTIHLLCLRLLLGLHVLLCR